MRIEQIKRLIDEFLEFEQSQLMSMVYLESAEGIYIIMHLSILFTSENITALYTNYAEIWQKYMLEILLFRGY